MSDATRFVGESHSAIYAKFRPIPPSDLINKIISYVKQKIPGDLEKAADIGCGTGQSTQILKPYFQHITGFDISETQIKEAREQSKDTPNITYCASPAETLPIADQSLQLVNVAQAVHWFNLPEFFKEAHRVLMPNGVCAISTYMVPMPIPENPAKTKEMQDLMWKFYNNTLGPYWSERTSVFHNNYKDVEFSDQYFTNVVRDETVVDHVRFTLGDYIGLVSTWSGYQQMKSQDPEGAKKALDHVTESIINIIEDKNKDPSKIPVTLELQYILLMGRKKQ